jgi:hypothetical protein
MADQTAIAQEQEMRDERHLDRELDLRKTGATLDQAANIELFRSALEAGQTALKMLTTINGGAAAALLAFLSNLVGKQPGSPIQANISVAMAIYVGGVAVAGASSVCRYFTQYAATRATETRLRQKDPKGWIRVGNVFTFFAMAFGIGSLVAFCAGGWKSFRALHG